MEWLNRLLGNSTELSIVQMCIRAFIIFIAAYFLIRISGRRSFALRSSLDNIIVILLGAVLSRAIVGASPFLPVLGASLLLVILHRFLAWFTSSSPKIGKIISGRKILLYDHGKFVEGALKKALISKEEIMEKLHQQLHSENIGQIERIYMERDGQISLITSENDRLIPD